MKQQDLSPSVQEVGRGPQQLPRPHRALGAGLAALLAAGLVACGDDADTGGTAGAGGDTSSPSAQGSGGNVTSTTANGGGSNVADPASDGPYAFEVIDDTADVTATDNSFGVRAFVPTTGPTPGPYPLVIVAHGFQLPSTQYEKYAERLATFGFVAVTAEYPTSFITPSHVDNALDLVGVIDWAAASPDLAGKVDAANTGMTGHSLGGKVSLLAATKDARVRAVIALDPVDTATACNATDCPDVSALMPSLAIPTGFLGETTDATGSGMACAPQADNYATFYTGAQSPSFAVTITGANHMSFLDDVGSCGLACAFCNPSTAVDAEVNAMSRAYVAAFFERHLRGDTAYDAYLTGSIATERYVTPGKATLEAK